MKNTTIETSLFSLMLLSTIVIMYAMFERDVNVCLIAFATFLFASITLIVKLKK